MSGHRKDRTVLPRVHSPPPWVSSGPQAGGMPLHSEAPHSFLKPERMMWRQGSDRWKICDSLLRNNIATLEQQQQIRVTELRKYLTNRMTYLGARCQNSRSSHWHCRKWTDRNLSACSLLPPPSAGLTEGDSIYVHKNLIDTLVHDLRFFSNFLKWKMKWYFNYNIKPPVLNLMEWEFMRFGFLYVTDKFSVASFCLHSKVKMPSENRSLRPRKCIQWKRG